MALNRTNITPIDDDGSDTYGTVFDAAWWEDVYDEIDAAIVGTKLDDFATPDDNTDLNVSTSRHGLTPKITGSDGHVLTKSGTAAVWSAPAGGGTPTEQTTTVTGNQDNFSLSASFTVLRCTGAAPVFRGFTIGGSAPTAGARVIIQCLGSTSAKVAHQDANSTAANRIICPSTNGQIVGVDGCIHLVYDGTTSRWRQSYVDPGAWLDYTSTSTITGWSSFTSGRKFIFYRQMGKRIDVAWHLEGTSNSTLTKFTLPFTSANIGTAFNFAGVASLHYDNGSYPATTGVVSCVNNTNVVDCFMSYAGAAWTASGTKIAEGQIVVEIT